MQHQGMLLGSDWEVPQSQYWGHWGIPVVVTGRRSGGYLRAVTGRTGRSWVTATGNCVEILSGRYWEVL